MDRQQKKAAREAAEKLAPPRHKQVPHPERPSPFDGFSWKGVYGRSWITFAKDLNSEINEDNVFNGGAALGFYFTLAIFPAMIFLLSLLPYLPIHHLADQLMAMLHSTMPGDAAKMFTDTIESIVNNRRGGLLSVGFLLTLWAASTGMYAVMQQLNITYDVKEGRPFWKVRATAVGLTVVFGALVITAFALIVAGGAIQNWLQGIFHGSFVVTIFALVRWLIIAFAMITAFALAYYYGPDVEQRFRFITPGSLLGVIALGIATLAFRFYVDHFGNYNATYGGLGAMIALMLWLNVAGTVILLGSEVNALIEHYSPDGKQKGLKDESSAA